MKPDELDILKEHIELVIQRTVNGKIDKLNDKMEEHNRIHEAHMETVVKHMEETKPILEAYRGFNTAGELIKWIAGVGTALGVLWLMVTQLWTK